MDIVKHNLILADDDIDDCIFFQEALEDLSLHAGIQIAHNGIELMRLLNTKLDNLPDILFLDLNMPRKTGLECLSEIKLSKNLKNIPVIVFTTSYDDKVVDLLYEKGANYFMRKPGEFSKLKQLIYKAITLISSPDKKQTDKENFVLNSR